MKKLLIAVAAIALLVWVASWFRSADAVNSSAARPWPGGMGQLDSVAKRLPALHANEASVKLTALAKALPKNDAADAFVAREVSRGELAIGGTPALTDVSAIRDLLLREPVVWERADGIGGDNDTQSRRALHMTVARALVASALAKGGANDPAAWEDLHAAWNLARSLDGHPQVMVQTAALSMSRMINAVAWKMPLPAPAWLDELQRLAEQPHEVAVLHFVEPRRHRKRHLPRDGVDRARHRHRDDPQDEVRMSVECLGQIPRRVQVLPGGHVVLACAPEGVRHQDAHQRLVHLELRQ